MSWELGTSGAALLKAGINCHGNLKLLSGAFLDTWYNEAAAIFCADTRKNWSGANASTQPFKELAGTAITDLVAMRIINYDMSGYTSRLEAQTMLDFLLNDYNMVVAQAKEDDVKSVMGVT